MKDYKTEGIIIRVRDYNEADRLITIFSREYGKIQAIAKGCRKPKSRKRGVLQLFTFAEFALYRGRTLDTITQCEAREPFSTLREDLDRMAYGLYLAELLDGFVTAGEAHQELFYLALVCLHLLTVEDPELVIRTFEIRMMDILGYKPHLEGCVNCSGSFDGGTALFSSRLGGTLCQACKGLDQEAVSCSLGALNLLKQLIAWDLRRLRVLRLAGSIKKEVADILGSYIGHRLEKKIRTADFLKALSIMQNNG